MRTFTECDASVTTLVDQVRKQFHVKLEAAGVTVGCVFARSVNEETGEESPCLKKHGFLVAARIKITPLEGRARKLPDAQMTIDGYVWDRLIPDERRAVIDHELMHLVASGEDWDDLGRPKLSVRHHDWMLAGFADIAKRYGRASQEVLGFKNLVHDHGQYLLFEKAVPGRDSVDVKLTSKIDGQEETIFEGTDRDFREVADSVGR